MATKAILSFFSINAMARRRLGFPLSFPPSAVFNEDSKYGKLHEACKNYVVPLDTKAFLEIDTNLVSGHN